MLCCIIYDTSYNYELKHLFLRYMFSLFDLISFLIVLKYDSVSYDSTAVNEERILYRQISAYVDLSRPVGLKQDRE